LKSGGLLVVLVTNGKPMILQIVMLVTMERATVRKALILKMHCYYEIVIATSPSLSYTLYPTVQIMRLQSLISLSTNQAPPWMPAAPPSRQQLKLHHGKQKYATVQKERNQCQEEIHGTQHIRYQESQSYCATGVSDHIEGTGELRQTLVTSQALPVVLHSLLLTVRGFCHGKWKYASAQKERHHYHIWYQEREP